MDTATAFQIELLEPLGGDQALNLFRTLANHPRLLKRWLPFGGSLLNRNSLPDRDRELVILRVAALCGSDYEWGQHVAIARSAGISDEEIVRVGRISDRYPGPDPEPSGSTWNAHEQTLLGATDQLVRDHRIDDDLWERLTATYDVEQLVSLTLLAGHYAMLAGFLSSARVRTEGPLPRIGQA